MVAPEPESAPAAGVRFEPSDIAQRHTAAWGGIRADSVEITRRDPFDYKFRSPQHLLIMSERAARDEGETHIEGLPKSTLHEFSRKMTLVPAGHDFHGWQKPRMLTRVTYFYIDPQALPALAQTSAAAIDFQPRLFFFDRDLWETAAKLKEQADHPESAQQSYGEALSAVLAHELLRVNNAAAAVQPRRRGGLSGWQQKQARSYIEAHLSEDISLKTLAEQARLSIFHFARAFRQSFEQPPHRYLAIRRLERAQELLGQSELSVTEIGIKVGFSDTSSFTAAFRKHTGLTPTDFRRSIA
jgi:AraC family transcriptional regulator